MTAQNFINIQIKTATTGAVTDRRTDRRTLVTCYATDNKVSDARTDVRVCVLSTVQRREPPTQTSHLGECISAAENYAVSLALVAPNTRRLTLDTHTDTPTDH